MVIRRYKQSWLWTQIEHEHPPQYYLHKLSAHSSLRSHRCHCYSILFFHIPMPSNRHVIASVFELAVFLAQCTCFAKAMKQTVSTRVFFQHVLLSHFCSVETWIETWAASHTSYDSVKGTVGYTRAWSFINNLRHLSKSNARTPARNATVANVRKTVA